MPPTTLHLSPPLPHRFARASNQIRTVAYNIREAQEAEGIPASRVLSTIDTMPTRWGNQYSQIERNNTLKPIIEPVIERWKGLNRGKKDAIVEEDDSTENAKVGVAVASSQLGLSYNQWDNSLELESFLLYPFGIKQVIEHKPKGSMTGA